jgi:ribose 5-phosphate isomerase B
VVRQMKIFIGADHGGFMLKEKVNDWYRSWRYEVCDVGAKSMDSEDDFVDYALLVAREVRKNPSDRGILFCRSGLGMMIVANRLAGVRCGLAFDVEAVKRGRSDDDINCLAIPADYLTEEEVREMIGAFLETPFSGEERFVRRLKKLAAV